jgi:outer membrane protein
MRYSFLVVFWELIFFGLSSSISGQEMWSLEKCISKAQENNLTLMRAKNTVQDAALAVKQERVAALPNLSANLTGGFQLGRTIDPSTNSFSTQNVGFNQGQVSFTLPVYQGGRIRNGIQGAKLNAMASRADLEQSNNDVALQVARAYLQILLAEENAENAKRRVLQSKAQLENTEKLIKAGNLPENDKFNAETQVALDEQGMITAENNIDLSYLSLKLLMQISPDTKMKIEKPSVVIPINDELESKGFSSLYTKSLGTQPNIKAGEFRLMNAQKQVRITKAGLYPNVSLFANLTSNYSSINRDFSNPDLSNLTLVPNTPEPVLLNGQQALLTSFSLQGVTFPYLSYLDQLDRNFGQGFGLSLNFPIYGNHQTRVAGQRAALNIKNVEIANEQLKQQLKNDVMQALTSAKAGKKQYQASLKSNNAAKASFEGAQKRFSVGSISIFELNNARFNLDRTETDLVNSKYDYLFRLKILDFYEGKRISLQ